MPVLILISGLPLGYGYFTWPETGGGLREQIRDFYLRIDPDWIRLSETELETILREGNPGHFETYATRAALARWRVREIAPEAFDLIMDEYEEGLWLSPPHETWEELFRENDIRWIDARRKAKAEQQALSVQMLPEDNRLVFAFGNATTAQIGSAVYIVMRAPKGQPLPPSGRILWKAGEGQGLANYRSRLVPVRPINEEANADAQTFAFEFDLSWEPAWLNPEKRSVEMILEAQNLNMYEFVTVLGRDSPYLDPSI